MAWNNYWDRIAAAGLTHRLRRHPQFFGHLAIGQHFPKRNILHDTVNLLLKISAYGSQWKIELRKLSREIRIQLVQPLFQHITTIPFRAIFPQQLRDIAIFFDQREPSEFIVKRGNVHKPHLKRGL